MRGALSKARLFSVNAINFSVISRARMTGLFDGSQHMADESRDDLQQLKAL